MKIGFTGSQNGITRGQEHQLRVLLTNYKSDNNYLFHGGCVGGDDVADRIAAELGYERIVFLGPDPRRQIKIETLEKRGRVTITHPPELLRSQWSAYFMKRNSEIIQEVKLLIACPAQVQEVLRSGTWSTIRRAWKARKPVHLVTP